MRPIYSLFILICLLFPWSPVRAATTDAAVPEDFAYGLELSVDSAGGLNALPLPGVVYDALARGDYGDLRVFNTKGKAVAHTLHAPEGPPPPEEWTTVARFPLPPARTPGPGGSRIHIETRADGTIVDIRPSASETAAPEAAISRHVLDLSGIDEPVDRLRVSFASDHRGLTSLSVERSDDLARWHPIVPQAAVGNLDFQGHRLGRSEVALPVRAYTYLRLSWSSPLTVGALADVSVRKPPHKTPLPREELTLGPLETETVDGRTFVLYKAPGRRPVDRVRIDLPSVGTLARVALYSRPDEEADWRRHHSGLAYNLNQNGAGLSNAPVRITATSEPHWRLEIQSDPALLNRLPSMVLGWRPHRLVFAATDGGPFRLAYGSARVPPADSHLEDLLQTLKGDEAMAALPQARAGQPFELGGRGRLTDSSEAWKRYLLWGGMVLAVGLIGGLALRLYGQVKKETIQGDSDVRPFNSTQ
jgi:hypothetical protein